MNKSEPRKIAILTKNRYLYQKLYLELCLDGDFLVTERENAEILLCDIDTEKKIDGAVLMSYLEDRGADIVLPARIGAISAFLKEKQSEALKLDKTRRLAIINGAPIKLTEIEFTLFSLLFERCGFVSREEILNTVWGGEADSGVVNVYIHYLREKLEKGGEKIIISSRKMGYRISEKYCKEEKL